MLTILFHLMVYAAAAFLIAIAIVFVISYFYLWITGMYQYGRGGFDMVVTITVLGHTFELKQPF